MRRVFALLILFVFFLALPAAGSCAGYVSAQEAEDKGLRVVVRLYS